MDAGVGVGLIGLKFKFPESTGNTLPMHQAEMHAIETCAQKCLWILSDSQAALKVLTLVSRNWPVTPENLRIRVPDHMGAKGNEKD